MDWFHNLDRGSREMILGMAGFAALVLGGLVWLDYDARSPGRKVERVVRGELHRPDAVIDRIDIDREAAGVSLQYAERLVCARIDRDDRQPVAAIVWEAGGRRRGGRRDQVHALTFLTPDGEMFWRHDEWRWRGQTISADVLLRACAAAR